MDVDLSKSCTQPTTPLSKNQQKKQQKIKNIQKFNKRNENVNIVSTLEDLLVQATNDSSITSKRSMTRAGYANDDFGRHFVLKPSRRSPLINRFSSSHFKIANSKWKSNNSFTKEDTIYETYHYEI